MPCSKPMSTVRACTEVYPAAAISRATPVARWRASNSRPYSLARSSTHRMSVTARRRLVLRALWWPLRKLPPRELPPRKLPPRKLPLRSVGLGCGLWLWLCVGGEMGWSCNGGGGDAPRKWRPAALSRGLGYSALEACHSSRSIFHSSFSHSRSRFSSATSRAIASARSREPSLTRLWASDSAIGSSSPISAASASASADSPLATSSTACSSLRNASIRSGLSHSHMY